MSIFTVPGWLFRITTIAAPALNALVIFSVNVQFPRRISATAPLKKLAGNGGCRTAAFEVWILTGEMPNWKIGERSAIRRSAPFVEANILGVRRRTAWTARREHTIEEHLVLGGRGHCEDPGTTVIDLANGIGNAGAGVACCCRNQHAGIYNVEEVSVIIGPWVGASGDRKTQQLTVAMD